MIKSEFYDVAVIGAGAAGLAAGSKTANSGKKTIIIDREEFAGGILRQCIHNGFGLKYFKEELTGPEYAEKMVELAQESGASLRLSTTILEITGSFEAGFKLMALSPLYGVVEINAKVIILAMGCRERNRGNLGIAGSRVSGVYTAGAAQKLLNMSGVLTGKSAVIVGSGDIGLIMARRLTWSGIKVKAVVEIMPYPAGLPRNLVQCLDDFNIPLYLSHSVVNIVGKDTVSGVEIAPLENGAPQGDKKFFIDCDSVLFSVGLVPENELVANLDVELNPSTFGAKVDANFETSVKGIFAGGNVLHVHDLVDFVSEESERAAVGALKRLESLEERVKFNAKVKSNLKYVVPSFYYENEKTRFAFRPLIVADEAILSAELNGEVIYTKSLKAVKPAEMIMVDLAADLLNNCGDLTFNLMPKEL